MQASKNFNFSGSWSKMQNGDQNRIYPRPLSHSPDCKMFPFNTPIARAVLDSRAVREGPYVNGKPRATGRATKFQTK